MIAWSVTGPWISKTREAHWGQRKTGVFLFGCMGAFEPSRANVAPKRSLKFSGSGRNRRDLHLRLGTRPTGSSGEGASTRRMGRARAGMAPGQRGSAVCELVELAEDADSRTSNRRRSPLPADPYSSAAPSNQSSQFWVAVGRVR